MTDAGAMLGGVGAGHAHRSADAPALAARAGESPSDPVRDDATERVVSAARGDV